MKKALYLTILSFLMSFTAHAGISKYEGDAAPEEKESHFERRGLTSPDRIEARKERIKKERAARAAARKKAARRKGGGCGPSG